MLRKQAEIKEAMVLTEGPEVKKKKKKKGIVLTEGLG